MRNRLSIVIVVILIVIPLILQILPTWVISEKIFQIFVVLIILLFFIFYGMISIFTGFSGISKGEIELFWKKNYNYGKFWEDISKRTGHSLKSEVDIAKGNYAKFWGVIYIFIGAILLISSLFLLIVLFSVLKT